MSTTQPGDIEGDRCLCGNCQRMQFTVASKCPRCHAVNTFASDQLARAAHPHAEALPQTALHPQHSAPESADLNPDYQDTFVVVRLLDVVTQMQGVVGQYLARRSPQPAAA